MLLFDEDLLEADEADPLDEVEMERGDAFWFSAIQYQTVRSYLCKPCSALKELQHPAEKTIKGMLCEFHQVLRLDSFFSMQ